MWNLSLLLHFLVGLTNTEEISRLPGAERLHIGFKHFSGYFQVSETHFLHYWFVESQHDPKKDPLIFWFNGGPGCSSLDGLLNEMGPYIIENDGKTLRNNSFAWNKMASIVYTESPVGVGYSYTTDGIIKPNDEQTAEENYLAVKEFFKIFPSFRNNPVYIMGESYGGIYVPTLAVLVIRGLSDFPINLKGIAIGNGYINEVLNIDTSICFAYNHGLVDEKTWITMMKECCNGCMDTCDLSKVKQKHCAMMVEEIFQFIWFGGLNPYDLYRDCDSHSERSGTRMRAMKFGLMPRLFNRHTFQGTEIEPWKFVQSFSPSYGDVPCLNDSAMIRYMNSAEVRQALHIPHDQLKWDMCSDEVTENYVKMYNDMAPFIKEIIKANVRVLLYYGDTDIACNFMMGQQFSASLKLPKKRGKEPWMFNKQIAGFQTQYEGLTFVTIRGAGHMAPQWRPSQMQYVIRQFIADRPI